MTKKINREQYYSPKDIFLMHPNIFESEMKCRETLYEEYKGANMLNIRRYRVSKLTRLLVKGSELEDKLKDFLIKVNKLPTVDKLL